LAFGEDVVWDAAEFADEAEPGEDFEGVESEIDSPPVKALAGGGHEVVMIVVPTFAEDDEGEGQLFLLVSPASACNLSEPCASTRSHLINSRRVIAKHSSGASAKKPADAENTKAPRLSLLYVGAEAPTS